MIISKNSLHIGLVTGGLVSLAACSMLLFTTSTKAYADVSTNNQNTACSQSGGAQTDPSNTATSDPLACSAPTDPTTTTAGTTGLNTTSGSTDTPTNNSNCSAPSSNGPSDAQPSSITTNATIDSCNNLVSTSGSAAVTTPDSGGTSSSGNSQSTLNNVNEISTSSNNTNPPTNFSDNVYGDQTGNIVVNPALANPSQTGVSNNIAGATTNSTINNNDNLTATSGNSTVTNGGNGGAATSGNAEAIANIVNIINSMVADQQSFVGTINIYGNLYGDILLPQQLIDQLMSASAVSPSSSSYLSNNTVTVNNNVQLLASSGSAFVANNGNGGAATTGDASTMLDIQNYINSIVSANNLFLIIVNVSGQWYGYVLGSIPQTNVFMLGSGLLNQNSTQNSNDTTPVINSTETINNNISLSAYSGNAAVYNQGNGGTATSGNAKVVANIFNFINDSFNISGWFGVLFINIFGNWYGSLSTYDASADPITQNAAFIASSSNDPSDQAASNDVSWRMFVIPSSNNSPSYFSYNSLDNVKNTAAKTNIFSLPANITKPPKHINYWLAIVSLVPIILLIIFEKFVYNKNR